MKRSMVITVTLMLGAASISATPAEAAFPGRNGKILFADGLGSGQSYAVMNPDGSGRKVLVSGRRVGFQAVFSPDGRQILFEEYLASPRGWGNNGLYQSHVWVMNADGSGLRDISEQFSDDSGPAWSPDGSKVVFAHASGVPGTATVNTDLWVMNPDGTEAQPLLDGPENDYSPKWSPDGRRIAFTRYVESAPYPLPDDAWFQSLFVADADGTNVRQLVDVGPGDMILYFDWSPDGRFLVYDRMVAPSYKSDLWIVRSDGTGARRLTKTPKYDEFIPIWSPDGKYIAFTSDDDGDSDIYRTTPSGNGRKNITRDEVDSALFDWQAIR